MREVLYLTVLLAVGLVKCDVCSVEDYSSCNVEEYDYVIIGGGTAGSILASKLSENGQDSVLVLEAGPLPDEYISTLHSDRWLDAASDSRLDWAMPSLPHSHLSGRTFLINQGKLVGGCSSHNAQYWVFGNKNDWNYWDSIGASGWNYTSVKPYKEWLTEIFKPRFAVGNTNGLGEAFSSAASGAGWPVRKDYNNPEEGQLGWSLIQHNTEVVDGQTHRRGVYQTFLKNDLKRKNLHLITGAHVSRILFDENKVAQYVEYYLSDSKEKPKIIKISREAIISAGSLRTPQILMLSGIGPEGHLKDHGISTVVNLPGVGFNLQDHPFVPTTWKLKKPVPSQIDYWGTYVAFGRFDGKWDDEGWADWQIIPITRKEYLQDYPILAGCEIKDGERYGLVFFSKLLHPYSTGYVKLANSNPFSNPIYYPNYGADVRDLEGLKKGIYAIRELLNRPELSDWVEGESSPGPNIDGSALDDYIKESLGSVWHPVGTARMGRESDYWSVVDHNLKVKGVKRLRVVDASVLPTLTSGNTHLPTMIVASRAAQLILSDQQK